MYAIFETGGKQYQAQEGDVVRVEHLAAEDEAEVSFDRVLAVVNDGLITAGTPTVAGARVVGRVVKQGLSPKILVFKYKPKVNYRKRYGHRQSYTAVRIERIEA